MIESIIGALIGPVGGIVAGIGAIIAALFLGRYTGGRDARVKRDAQDGKDYIKERGKIDDEISGIGGNDADNIKRLRAIANRRGAGKN